MDWVELRKQVGASEHPSVTDLVPCMLSQRRPMLLVVLISYLRQEETDGFDASQDNPARSHIAPQALWARRTTNPQGTHFVSAWHPRAG